MLLKYLTIWRHSIEGPMNDKDIISFKRWRYWHRPKPYLHMRRFADVRNKKREEKRNCASGIITYYTCMCFIILPYRVKYVISGRGSFMLNDLFSKKCQELYWNNFLDGFPGVAVYICCSNQHLHIMICAYNRMVAKFQIKIILRSLFFYIILLWKIFSK